MGSAKKIHFKKHVDVVLRDMVSWEILVIAGWLDWMILEVFSSLGDSVILNGIWISAWNFLLQPKQALAGISHISPAEGLRISKRKEVMAVIQSEDRTSGEIFPIVLIQEGMCTFSHILSASRSPGKSLASITALGTGRFCIPSRDWSLWNRH